MFEQINRLAASTPWLDPVVAGYASYGVIAFAVLLAVGWWTARLGGRPDKVATAMVAGPATLLAVGLNQPLVRLVHEPRPYVTHPGILVLAHRTSDFAFPSDHAVMAGAVSAGLWLVSRRLGLITALAAVVLGFARVYIGVHYPHDVVAGLVLGAGIAIATCRLLAPPTTRLVRRASETCLRPLVQPT